MLQRTFATRGGHRQRAAAMLTVLLVASLAGASRTRASQTVVLRDETIIKAKSVVYEGDTLIVDGERRIPRDKVYEVYFVESGLGKAGKVIKGTAEKAKGKELERLRRWYGKSDALQKRFPESDDGVILLDQATYEREADGRYKRTYHGIVHCLNDATVKGHARFVGWMEEGRSRWIFKNVTVYHRNGTVYRFNPSRIQTREREEGARFFTRGKLVVYPVEGMAKDAIIDYTYTTDHYNPFRKDFFFPRWGFQSPQPTDISRLVLRLPAKEPFYYSLYNVGTHAPVVSDVTQGDKRLLTFELENVPPFVAEGNSVQYGDVAPYFRGALFKGWKRIYRFLGDLQKKHVKASPELSAFTRKLVTGCKTDREKVARIYHFLQEKIRYIAIKMGVASGWGGYEADVTFKKKFGCCIDKAILFTAMLNAVGVWSTPIVVMTNSQADIKWNLPQIGFNHAISMVKLDGKRIFLDSTGSNYRFPSHSSGNHGINCINAFEDRIEKIPTPKPSDNSAVYLYDLNLTNSGDMEVAWRPKYSGAYEAMLRGYYKHQKEDNRKRIIESIISREHPRARLKSDKSFAFHNLYDLAKPFSFEIEYVLPHYCKEAGPLRIFDLPSNEMNFGEAALKEREFSMEYASSYQKKRIYNLRYPKNLRLKILPKDVTLKNPHASYTLRFERSGQGRLRIVSDYQRHARIVKPTLYPAYRSFLNEVAAATRKKIFFEVMQ